MWSSNPTPGRVSRENSSSKRHKHPNSSTLYNSQNTEATQVSINGRLGKEDAVYLYKGILLSHKKEISNAI